MASVVLHRRSGRGPLPLVLLAPFPLDGRVWSAVADLVGGDVITVDPPGFGGRPDEAPSLEGYASAVLRALDAVGVTRFVIAGNSMGGYAAMALADIAPERLAGIGLFGTKSTADAPEGRAGRIKMADAAASGAPVAELLAGLRGNLLGTSTKEQLPGLVSRLDALLSDASGTGVAWAQRAMAERPDRTGVLARLSVPAVVVHGVEDALMAPETQTAMAEALGVEVISLPGIGHLVPLEAPDAAARALIALKEKCVMAFPSPDA